ncbi:MAG: hypothetical protein R3E89_15225 [Thiolinea sp.]
MADREIYHATHRLFLSDDCLYLLLWAEETEEHPDETPPSGQLLAGSYSDLGEKVLLFWSKTRLTALTVCRNALPS